MTDREASLRKFLDFLHEHQDLSRSVLGDEKEWLPEIAVMGDTSCGKSSLLSALSGIEFPVSNGLCTRHPIRLRMERKVGSPQFSVTAVDVLSGTRYGTPPVDNINDVPRMITEGHNFCSKPECATLDMEIDVHIAGPEGPNLTLLDLPGFISTVGRGEDPGLVDRLTKLHNRYLMNPRCLILAVHSADSDFHNSTIFSKARMADSTTSRIIPVLTKMDKVQPGEERAVVELALGTKTEEFKQHFHVVKCRSQNDVNNHVSIKTSIEEERSFFSTHKWTIEIPESYRGTPALAQRLSGLYLSHIKLYAPDIVTEVRRKCKEVTAKMNELAVDELSTVGGRRSRYIDAVDALSAYYTNSPLSRKVDIIQRELHEKISQHPFAKSVDEVKRKREEARRCDTLDVFISAELTAALARQHVSEVWGPIVAAHIKELYATVLATSRGMPNNTNEKVKSFLHSKVLRRLESLPDEQELVAKILEPENVINTLNRGFQRDVVELRSRAAAEYRSKSLDDLLAEELIAVLRLYTMVSGERLAERFASVVQASLLKGFSDCSSFKDTTDLELEHILAPDEDTLRTAKALRLQMMKLDEVSKVVEDLHMLN